MNTFTISDFISIVNKRKMRIILHLVIALVVGIIVAFSLPKEYSSSCVLVAETQQSMLSGNSLGGLASMAGINMNNSEDAIIPDFYPIVVKSYPFVVELLYDTVYTQENKRMLVLEYLQDEMKTPWWSSVFFGITSLFKGGNSEKNMKNARINPQYMTQEQETIVKGLAERISCSISSKDESITVSAMVQDPQVAKMLVDGITKRLQSFIVKYRTAKVKNDVEYYKKEAGDMRTRYKKAQQKYAAYCDSHGDVILQAYISERDNLENEMQLAQNAYTAIEQQLMKAEAKYRERIPAFTVIEPSSVPNKKTSPKRMFVIIAFLFVCGSAEVIYIYSRLLFGKSL